MRFLAIFLIAVLSHTFAIQKSPAQDSENAEQTAISAKQLVVMIDGRFPVTGALTSGAGLVVGRKGGLVYIATVGHVVVGLTESATDIKVQFQDRPGDEIDATLWPSNFDKGVDVAILVVPEDRAPATITSLDAYPAARLSQDVNKGEGAFLYGQPQGRVWSGNKIPEKVVATTSTSIEIKSNTVVPGMSGGATLDEGLRIMGLIVETENGVARAITVRYLKEILDSSGYPFDITDVDGELPDFVPNLGSVKERLSIALSSRRFEELLRFPRSERIALLTESILANDKSVRNRFFSELKDEEALKWFGDIIKKGLDPNFIVDSAGGRSALYYALASNNIRLAIVLLENGASPHAYQKLWGNETKSVSILNPLDWLSLVSASEEEKRELSLAMAEAGLAVLVQSPSGQYEFDTPDVKKNVQLLQFLGIPAESVDALRRDNRRCRAASENADIDWCSEMEKVPTYIENITGAGDDLDEGFLIGRLIGIYRGRMYFFALGANGDWAGHPPSLAVISRGRDNVLLYRYSRNGAGLGHCSRLRDRAAGREVGDYKDSDRNAYCWRRSALSRTIAESGYDNYWEQSYYCRNGSIENSKIDVIKYPNRTWSEVPEEERMRGRVRC